MSVLYGFASVAAAGGRHDHERLADDPEVAPKAPVLDVLAVEFDAPFVFHLVAAVDLPGAGQARAGAQIRGDVVAIFPHFRRDDRPRPDEAHLALEDVPQLRQFVEAALAQYLAKRRDARVVLELLCRVPLLARGRIRAQMP